MGIPKSDEAMRESAVKARPNARSPTTVEKMLATGERLESCWRVCSSVTGRRKF